MGDNAHLQVFGIGMKSVFCFSRYENSTTDLLEDSLSHRTTKEKVPEQEFHEASENLSRRLNELDLVSKNLFFVELSNPALVMTVKKNINVIWMKRKSATNTWI